MLHYLPVCVLVLLLAKGGREGFFYVLVWPPPKSTRRKGLSEVQMLVAMVWPMVVLVVVDVVVNQRFNKL